VDLKDLNERLGKNIEESFVDSVNLVDFKQIDRENYKTLTIMDETQLLPTKAICNGWGKCKYKVLSSLLRLVTVDRYVFKNQPLQIAKRCGQGSETIEN
jgi:hypothetical protein